MMKKLFVCLLLAMLPCLAWAAPPPCLPHQWAGSGTDYVAAEVTGGSYTGWWCQVDGVWKAYGFVNADGYVLKHPTTTGMTLRQTFDAYWALNVTGDFHNDPVLAPIAAEMDKALATIKPAAEAWVVAASTAADHMRPTYKISNAQLVIQTQRVLEGSTCNCTRLKFMQTATTPYCSVLDSDLVAYCRKVQ